MNFKSRKVAYAVTATVATLAVTCAVAFNANTTKDNSKGNKGQSIVVSNIDEKKLLMDVKGKDVVIVGVEEDKTEVATEEQTEAVTEEQAEAKIVSAYENKFMVNVDEYLNIRAIASEDGEVVGKLYAGAGGDVVEKGSEWTHITSGGVEGFVKNEFILTGEQAEQKANEVGKLIATVTEDSIRMRETPDENGKIYTLCGIGDTYTCQAQLDGWVQVEYDDGSAYIASDFVSVELKIGKAISIEEERAAIEAAEAEERARLEAEEEARRAEEAEAEEDSYSESSYVETVQTDSYDVSYDDAYMLACLVQSEAGSEPYEGKLATANIVLNRLNSGRYGSSISDVIYAPGQFSVVRIGTFQSALSNGPSSESVQAANEALAGVNNVPGYGSFCSLSVANYSRYNSYVVIGNQVYYN